MDVNFYKNQLDEEATTMSRTKLFMLQLVRVLLQKPRLILVSSKALNFDLLMDLLMKNIGMTTLIVSIDEKASDPSDLSLYDNIIHMDRGMIRSFSGKKT